MGKPTQKVDFDEFWYYIKERWAIYKLRAAGSPPPWTRDPILRDWSFTNVFRQLDRGTVELWKWINGYDKKMSLYDLFFNIVYAREFNLPSTFNEIGHFTSERPWRPEQVKKALWKISERGDKVFTSAHLVRSENARPKIDSVVDLLVPIWKNRVKLVDEMYTVNSMKHAYEMFHQFYLIGDFMSYQFVLDLVDTPILENASDRWIWACLGPGAWKGLQWLGSTRRRDGLESMHKLLQMAQSNLPKEILRNKQYPFTVHEIEFSLCEFGKYCKIKYAGGSARNHYWETRRALPDSQVYNHGYKETDI